MSLVSFIGPRPNLLDLEGTAKHQAARGVPADPDQRGPGAHPPDRRGQGQPVLAPSRIDITYAADKGAAGMARGARRACAPRPRRPCAPRSTTSSSCRTAPTGPDRIPIPSLLATSAVHHHLIRQGLRTSVGLVVETGEAHEVHQFCDAGRLRRRGDQPLSRLRDAGAACCPSSTRSSRSKEAQKRYIKAIDKGLLKVMSKMGISTYQSYCGAQIFDAVGLQLELRRASISPARTRQVEGVGLRRDRARDGRAPPARPSATCRCSRTRSMSAANTPTASAARRTCGARAWSPTCSMRCAATCPSKYRVLRQADQRPVRAADDAARPVPHQDAPRRWAASRCRSRRSSRPPTSSSASRPAP